MYIPSNYRLDEYAVKYGPVHMMYEWSGDKKLATYWPSKEFCESRGWDQKMTVAAYHRKAIECPPGSVLINDGWKNIGVEVWPEKSYANPVIVFRLNLSRKWSQYLGWLTNEIIRGIEPVNCSRSPEYVSMRRMILMKHLSSGYPREKS